MFALMAVLPIGLPICGGGKFWEGCEFNRVVWLNVIWEVPRDRTVKVKVAMTPLPLTLFMESKVSDMSGM